MKPKYPTAPLFVKSTLATVLVFSVIADIGNAAALTWDSSPTAGIQAGNGTWDTTGGNTVWTSNGGTSNVAWTQTNATTATNSAIFAGADGTYAIDVDADLATQSFTFNNSGYTLSATEARTITNTGNIVMATGKTASIGNNVTVNSTAGTSYIGNTDNTDAGTLNIDTGAKVTATGNLRINGSGTIVNLSGELSGSGTNIQLANAANSSVTMNVNSGGSLKYTGSTTTTTGELRIGTQATSTATLNVNTGGLVDTGVNVLKLGQSGTTSNVNLNGGTLLTSQINFGAGVNTVKLNGGEIKASATQATFLTGTTLSGGGVHVHDGGALFNTNGNNISVSADLIHSTLSGASVTDGGLTKTGSGTLTLSGTSTYNGTTTVSAGTLLVTGSLGAGDVNVGGSATIGGTGALGGNLFLASGATLDIADINDALSVVGTITFGNFGFTNITGWDYANADTGTYTLLAGTADLTNVSNVGAGNALNFGNGKSGYFQNGSLQVVVVPEPASALLGSLGMLMLLRRRRGAA